MKTNVYHYLFCPVDRDVFVHDLNSQLGQQGYFASQAALHWYYHYGLEATFSFSLSLSRDIGPWGFPTTSLPPWSFLPMGIGEPHRDCLAFTLFDLATPSPGRRLHLGDALRWLWLLSRWLWPWLSQRPDTGRYNYNH